MVTCQPEPSLRRSDVSRSMRKVLITAAAAAAALSPALAYSDVAADGSFKAVDFGWVADGGSGNELTIAPGETVTFAYPTGASFHNVVFEGTPPTSCMGIEPDDPRPGWSGSCRFDAAGTYRFVCGVHAEMTGRVIVRAAPTPTPTPTIDPGGSPGPTATPTPTPRRTGARDQLEGDARANPALDAGARGRRGRAGRLAPGGDRRARTAASGASCAARPAQGRPSSRSGSTPRPARRCAPRAA